ncbi:hypothetical protein [Konateibacter massiliensis]|uniref:hypothetical protein n=1 Tax=Konateibacter massiliensis TaxID=2002841 RepID=UPI000C148B45|nr:hypothetical protein [Konateibacter massiliensis]
MSKALYYPFINIPEGSWLTQSLLYWDELSCMSPSIYFEQPNLYNLHMQEYIREGLVIPLSPAYFIWDIKNFEDNFLEYLDSDDQVSRIQKRVYRGYRNNYLNIHFEKLGSISDQLIKRGLAFKGQEEWLLVEPYVAIKFMTYLSFLIGSITNYDPITTENNSRYNFRKLPQSFKYSNLNNSGDIEINNYTVKINELWTSDKIRISREKILNNLLPAPLGKISAIDLLRFKDKHSVSLNAFRNYVEGFLIDYESTIDELKESKMEMFLANSREQQRQLEEEMHKYGWKHINRFDLVLYGLDLLTTFNAYQDMDMRNVSLGLTKFGITILKSLSDNAQRLNNINKKPMSYIINASRIII